MVLTLPGFERRSTGLRQLRPFGSDGARIPSVSSGQPLRCEKNRLLRMTTQMC
jgi:hypothetical protein